ncbi:MAG: hypothetical protein FWD12_08520 [Alphaproteobacteria bacterium]|nr:hypothetical protein [Alphaproteobacteria bacterium]
MTTETVRYCPSCRADTWHVDGVCEWADGHAGRAPPLMAPPEDAGGMKLGDVVEYHIIVQNGPDQWIPGRVIAMHSNGFTIEALGRPFDEGFTQVTLPFNGNRDGMWR